MERNLNFVMNFVIIVIFAVLAVWLSPYSTIDDVNNNITAKLKTELLSKVDTLNSTLVTELSLGTSRLCQHKFKHNRYIKELSIMQA